MNRQYKTTIIAFVCCIIAILGFHLLAVRPLAEDVHYNEDVVDQNKTRMQKRGWPTQATGLEQRLADERREMQTLKQRSNQLMQQMNKTFAAQVQTNFENKQKFMMHASRLDYEELFAQIADKFGEAKINVTPKSMNINENANVVYPLLLQLWMADDIVQTAIKNKLTFKTKSAAATDGRPDESQPGNNNNNNNNNDNDSTSADDDKQTAAIHFKNIKAHIRKPESEEPFMLEFPLEIEVIGELNELNKFMISLQNDEKLITTNLLTIKTLPPTLEKPVSNQVEAFIECSAFFRIDEANDNQAQNL